MKTMYISPIIGNVKIEPMTVIQATTNDPITPVDPKDGPSEVAGRKLYV